MVEVHEPLGLEKRREGEEEKEGSFASSEVGALAVFLMLPHRDL